MTIEIAAIPPATPPAMAPVLELCPPIGIGVAGFEEEPRESLLVGYGEELEAGVDGQTLVGPVEADTEEPDGPTIVPGPSSGVCKVVRCKCVTVTRGGRQGRRFAPPTTYDLLKFQ